MITATIFLSAFLLFLVQPIIAKLILPQFGGGVAVWRSMVKLAPCKRSLARTSMMMPCRFSMSRR